MNDELGSTFITLTDDEGNDIELEYVDAFDYKDTEYRVFLSTDTEESDEEKEDDGIVILKVINEGGEELLSTPDSDEELNEVYDYYMENLYEEE